MSGEICA